MSSNYGDSESSPKWNELRVYRFVMFCVPIFFTFVLLFLFYIFYLRPRRLNWSSLRMRTTDSSSSLGNSLNQSQSLTEVESGLRKEVRELLPIIIYKESFSVRDTQCSVCLGDYEAEERLQQIPACGHTFHINCIDHWLSSRATCPLCRLSLLPSPTLRPVISVAGVEEASLRPQTASHRLGAASSDSARRPEDDEELPEEPIERKELRESAGTNMASGQ